MAKKHNVPRPYTFFPWDTKDPCGKYAQPKANPDPPENSYPDDDIDRQGTKTYGRYIDNKGGKKKIVEMHGYGAAERGCKFHVDNEDRDPVRTKTK